MAEGGVVRRDIFEKAFSLTKLNQSPQRTQGKATVVTGRGGPYCCETSRLTDGEIVRLTRRLQLYLQDESWYSVLLKAEPTPGP
jgi:hypothetical protein